MERLPAITELNLGHATHEGMSGKHNEDSFGVFAWKLDGQRTLNLAVVADGVGGQIAGEVASRLAVNGVQEYFDQQERVNNISGHLEQAILAANEAVYQAGQSNEEYRGMSTTIVVAAVVENRLYTAHVGDSRIYLLRKGELRQLSTDHTWAQEAIEAGLLTREQARKHPNRNVIKRHLGGKLQIEIDHRMVLEPGQPAEEAQANQGLTLKPGDTVLLCSDGLSDMIDDMAILSSFQAHFHDLPAASRELIDKANRAGGKDNITAVLMQVPDGQAPVVATATTVITAPSLAATLAAAPAVANLASTEQVSTKRGKKLPVALLLAGGGGIALLLLAVVAGAFLLFNPMNGQEATPTAPAATPATVQEVLPLATPGAPATAPLRATDVEATPVADETPAGTPELIPTLRPTFTPTPRPTLRPPTSTPDLSPLETLTALPSPAPTNPPQATQPPRPTNPPPEPTDPPPPTNPPPSPTTNPDTDG
ncbi:MAG: protein phosphatase 2C domain-containing protein [Chloroflexi bacterium]|nr:protein phosphatase 2C domain-containing protein [Chloroflexota bacterium]MCI0574817.1 protein phosphatase 2C domain-containing protein [Chloroflexota bacterium]MCI0648292.1 protein phosphatase 2C domain-containing protein [Chloroflexota bacterium]MCI0728416.1 protein phosphatase 2C domain-containing protein [Chloroflexota bacterium]